MRRPCPTVLNGCLGGMAGVDSPITNVSAEAPDPLLFWGQIWNPYDPYNPVILGNGLDIKTDCDDFLHETFSLYDPIVYAETQLMADLKALAISLGCSWPDVTPPTNGNGGGGGDGDPTEELNTFINDAQTATVYCPDGSAFSYTVDAGTLVSPLLNAEFGEIWLLWANAWAQSYALQQASLLKDCIVRPERITPVIPGIPIGPITPPVLPPRPPGTGDWFCCDFPYWLCLGDELDSTLNTYDLSGSGSSAYTISVTSGSIPPGTSFVQTGPLTAMLTGTPSTGGFYYWQITAESVGSPTRRVELWDSLNVFGITNDELLPEAKVDHPYTYQFTHEGDFPPYTYTSSPAKPIPSWMTLSTSGEITGTPDTVEGPFEFNVIITDANGMNCAYPFNIEVTGPKFLNDPPNGTECVLYNFTFATDPTPCSFTGTVPDGLEMSSAGVVTGYPSTSGPQTFDVTAEDVYGNINTYSPLDKPGATINIADDASGFARSVNDLVWVENMGSHQDTWGDSTIVGSPDKGQFLITVTVKAGGGLGNFGRRWDTNLCRCGGEALYTANITAVCTFVRGGGTTQNYISIIFCGVSAHSGAGLPTGWSASLDRDPPTTVATPPNTTVWLQIAGAPDPVIDTVCTLTISITPPSP